MFDALGLYLEISPAGGRWWRFKYRFGGKEKRLSLGTYPETSIAEARERRDAARKLLAKGIDPSEQRQVDKHAAKLRGDNSFEAVAREWYEKQAHVRVPHHAAVVLRRLEGNLFPDIGDKPIAEVTAQVVLAAICKIEHRGDGHIAAGYSTRERARRYKQQAPPERGCWRY